MKCPYIQKQITVEEVSQEFDENECCTAISTKNIKNIELPECLKENCAAWQNGHCSFKGDV